MTKHFQRELGNLKKKLLSLGAIVENRVHLAARAIDENDTELAQQIIKTDYEIDELEMEIEEDCLKILALYQPVAIDLRFLSAVIKINNDLERIGDEAVNIAQRVITISKRKKLPFLFDYGPMIEKTETMIKWSLDSVVNLDSDLAIKVCLMDDEVDAIKVQAYQVIKQAIKDNHDPVDSLINLLLISRHLERMADHATNIAEEVVYMVEGEIFRHRNWDRDKD